MQMKISFIGAAICAFWVALAGALPAAIFWNLNYKGAFQIYLFFALLALAYMLTRAKTYGIWVESGYLTVRRGILIIARRTMPLNKITSLLVMQTPAQRLSKTCFLLVHTAAGSMLIAGLSLSDAEMLKKQVAKEGEC